MNKALIQPRVMSKYKKERVQNTKIKNKAVDHKIFECKLEAKVCFQIAA